MTLPLFTEFLSHAEGDTDTTKQDCELKAFKRLAIKIKQEFPELPLMILLDGLYASGPIFELCSEYGWDCMIVLKDKCLSSVWSQYQALKNLNPISYQGTWRGRRQQISWDLYTLLPDCRELHQIIASYSRPRHFQVRW